MALGANRREILRLVLRQGMLLTATGLAIGIALALGAAQVLESQLLGLAPTDPVSFAATTSALLTASIAACLIPARRAASLDPLRALRRE